MKPGKGIKPAPPTNEPGGVVDPLKVPDDDTTPNPGQTSPSITSIASSLTPSSVKLKKKKTIKPGNPRGGKALAQIPPGLGGAEIPQGPDGAASSTSLLKKKKKKKPKGTGSGSVSSSVTSKGSSIVSVGNVSKKSKKRPARPGQPAMAGSFKQKLKKFLNFGGGAIRVGDVENQEGDEGEVVPLCNKKTLMISLIVVISLIFFIVVIAIFAGPKAGGGQGSGTSRTNPTTSMTTPTTTSTTITSAPTTMYTPISSCARLNLKFPGVSDPTKLGEYCRDCFPQDIVDCRLCCGNYYAGGSSNDLTNCKRHC